MLRDWDIAARASVVGFGEERGVRSMRGRERVGEVDIMGWQWIS